MPNIKTNFLFINPPSKAIKFVARKGCLATSGGFSFDGSGRYNLSKDKRGNAVRGLFFWGRVKWQIEE